VSRVLLMVGTKKGAFLFDSDEDRRDWSVRGPFCEGFEVRDVTYDPSDGAIYAAATSPWFGHAVFRSPDLGATWTHSSEGLTYGEDGPKLTRVWNVTPAHGAVYAGVEPAGLFRSDDAGATWHHIEGLTNHPSRSEWGPGAGGLILHTIIPHPTDPDRMWVGASSVGVFETTDGGASWTARNRGVRQDYNPGEPGEVGSCVHKFAMAPGTDQTLYQQNHCGVYRSDDGGAHWTEITGSLPSAFGFVLGTPPREPRTAWVLPLTTPDKGRFTIDAKAAVWRTRDGGGSWERLSKGLPQENAWLSVLREAMGVDSLERPGVYFGAQSGQVFASADEGDTWREIAAYLPAIASVDVAVIAG
jgi:photosystem II stability/assembly factor-like uncharacterized protein